MLVAFTTTISGLCMGWGEVQQGHDNFSKV